MPPADGNAFLAPFVANALPGAFPLLDLLAICLLQAMVAFCCNILILLYVLLYTKELVSNWLE
jgi:hypothetical protein